MPYEFVEAACFSDDHSLPSWAAEIVKKKLEQIKQLDNPRLLGGSYRGKWAYPAGKLQIIAQIDDKHKRVVFIKVIKLP